MPIQRELDKVERVLRTTVSGPVTLHEIRNHIGLLRRTGACQMPEIIDARSAEHSGFSRHELLSMAHHARQSLGHTTPARRAVVVNGDGGGWSLARTFSALVAGWLRLGVFEDVESAQHWLRGTLIAPAMNADAHVRGKGVQASA
jgi:hypothetical protein